MVKGGYKAGERRPTNHSAAGIGHQEQPKDCVATIADWQHGDHAASAKLPSHHGLRVTSSQVKPSMSARVRETALLLDTQQPYGNTGVHQPHQQPVPFTTACAWQSTSNP